MSQGAGGIKRCCNPFVRRSVGPSVCMSVCLSHALMATAVRFKYWLQYNTNKKPTLEVEPSRQRGLNRHMITGSGRNGLDLEI